MELTETEIRALVAFSAPDAETRKELDALQREFGIAYPENYKKILLTGAEGHMGPILSYAVSELHFDFLPVKRERFEYVSMRVGKASRRILQANAKLARVVPIGALGNGDFVCLDFRRSLKPVVVLWAHEKAFSEAEPFSFLARDFDELLDRAKGGNVDKYKKADAALTQQDLAQLLGRT